MIRKKIMVIPLVAALALGGLQGCGNSSNSSSADANTDSNTSAQNDAPQEDNAADNSADAASDSSSTSENESNESSNDDAANSTSEADSSDSSGTVSTISIKGITERSDEMRDISAADLVAEMTAGWNLGNTLDATGSNDLSSETSWGNPKITKELIDTVCEKGFDSIRLPITWGNHVGSAPDYTIDPEWMDRVEEVVNYALDDGMYVLIDTHHEEMWRVPDKAKIDEVDAENIAIWNQIATRFKDYGDHLIFEGLNEPRTKGSAAEWSGGTSDERDCVNQLNKSFVDTVRATGGNNEKRLLVVTTYGDTIIQAAASQLEIPEDEHIAVAIHAYEPYDFTFASGTSSEIDKWTGSRDGDINTLILNLRKNFLNKGIPVLLTEYGAVNKSENTDEVRKWVTSYVQKATLAGVPCFWWDNGIYDQDGEKFAILNRKDLTWYREPVVDAIIRSSYANKQH
ncbi:glycoside hydrolase family 5 protein [Butyrivibrio sp. YAB3001]|uniref:glycoside hydrolase family 5 protein n=1 Tax=Butyrivibrio sp. YAB3001 TaxID=1520812 RepID=UPI0008F62881|nr:glycoside hydrolase family 5 protein [Butyrivibrio sp. YAB3001]SFB93761.1 endoglucanase [Butyrivibrio sp. YAB3001]